MALEHVIYVSALVTSGLASVAGALMFSVVEQIVGQIYAYGAWMVYAVHIGLSPWLTIPYSDAYGLIVPILILWIYCRPTENSKKIWIFKWVEIGFLAMSLGASVSILFYSQVVIPTVDFQEFPDVAFGPSHFLMMGLNDETLGGYSQEDVDFSNSFTNKAERQKENWRVIQERMQAYDTASFLQHVMKKTLSNFGDGTYAWGVEGRFYTTVYPDKNDTFSPFFKNVYYNDGKYYPVFATFEQFIWVMLLVCSSGAIFYYGTDRKRRTEAVSVILLTLIGLMLFVTLFETRARYLFIYGPFFIISACIGLQGYIDLIRSMRKNSDSKAISE